MSFGFPPKYAYDFPLEEMNSDYFLMLTVETAKKLEWGISHISDTGVSAYTPYTMNSGFEEVTITIHDQIATVSSKSMKSQIVDWGKNEENVNTFWELLSQLKKKLTKEEVDSTLEEIDWLKERQKIEEEIEGKEGSKGKERFGTYMSIFIPREGYFITPILIILNILIFIIMAISGVDIISPDGASLLKWGANFRPLTLDGQWWRLLTACFIHIGIMHLLLNMYALLYIGTLLEPFLGKTRFLTAYLFTGIVASLASLGWNENIISAGASGAIFGMYGVFIALLTTQFLDKSMKRTLWVSMIIFVGFNILNGLKPNSGIDNAAHIVGLLSGFLVGYAFIPSLKNYNSIFYKLTTVGVLTLFLATAVVGVCNALPNDLQQYDKGIQQFISMEEKALKMFDMPENNTKEELLSVIQDTGIYYWKENLKLIESFTKLDLPKEIQDRNEKLKTYCEIRIKSYKLIYIAIDEDTDLYSDQIKNYNMEIEQLIESLNSKE